MVNFWQNADFPSNSSCFNADAVCVTCTEEPDRDYDGMPDMVQGNLSETYAFIKLKSH